MSQIQSMLVKTPFRRKALVNDAHWYMGIEDIGKFEQEISPSILHYHRDDDHPNLSCRYCDQLYQQCCLATSLLRVRSNYCRTVLSHILHHRRVSILHWFGSAAPSLRSLGVYTFGDIEHFSEAQILEHLCSAFFEPSYLVFS